MFRSPEKGCQNFGGTWPKPKMNPFKQTACQLFLSLKTNLFASKPVEI
jgi:hypothetical protein